MEVALRQRLCYGVYNGKNRQYGDKENEHSSQIRSEETLSRRENEGGRRGENQKSSAMLESNIVCSLVPAFPCYPSRCD